MRGALAFRQARLDDLDGLLERLGIAVYPLPRVPPARFRQVLGELRLVEAVKMAAAAPNPLGACVAAERRPIQSWARPRLELGAEGVAQPVSAFPAR